MSLDSQDEQIVNQVDNQLDKLLEYMEDDKAIEKSKKVAGEKKNEEGFQGEEKDGLSMNSAQPEIQTLQEVMNKMTDLHPDKIFTTEPIQLPKQAYLSQEEENSNESATQLEFLSKLQSELERKTIAKGSDLTRNEAFDIYLEVKQEMNMPPTILQSEEIVSSAFD